MKELEFFSWNFQIDLLYFDGALLGEFQEVWEWNILWKWMVSIGGESKKGILNSPDVGLPFVFAGVAGD